MVSDTHVLLQLYTVSISFREQIFTTILVLRLETVCMLIISVFDNIQFLKLLYSQPFGSLLLIITYY